MGRVRRRLFQRQPDRFRDGVIADLTRRAGAGFVVQTVEALRRIAATPLAHGVRARLETNGDLLVLQPFRRRQDDPSPPRKPLRRCDDETASNSARSSSLKEIVTATLAINRAS